MEGRGTAIPLNTCIYITCNILGVSFWSGVHIMIWLCYSLFSLSCHQKLKSKLFNTERPESWRWKKINTCMNKASPRIRFIQYFIWDALRKMFCPNFKALYRVFDKILKRWQKLWSRRRTGKNILGNLHALNWKCEFLERIRLGACLLEKFWNLGLLECISSIPVQKLECFWVGWGARLEKISGEPSDTMTGQIHFNSVTYRFWPVKFMR